VIYTITEHGWYGKTAKDAMTTVRKKEPRNLAIANRSRSASYKLLLVEYDSRNK